MRIIKESIVRGKGFFSVVCDTVDDLWVIYNLVTVGDVVASSTHRKVAVGQGNEIARVRLNLDIKVEELLFDPEQGEIRVSGTVTSPVQEYAKMGAHHTLELCLHQTMKISKDEWDNLALESLRSAASGSSRGVELVAVMLEPGSAQVCLVSRGLTVVKSKVHTALPRKRSGEAQHAEASEKFLDAILAALIRALDWEALIEGVGDASAPPPILVASPGSLKDSRKILSDSSILSPAKSNERTNASRIVRFLRLDKNSPKKTQRNNFLSLRIFFLKYV